ncbi:MAG: hypothetical protein J7513_05840 [Solirubrobacteraceae bacterium]|nr:hypothetical protein [Solirubrobacteraceae bacterium]
MFDSLRFSRLRAPRRAVVRSMLVMTAALVPSGAAVAIADGTTPTARSLNTPATAARIAWTPPATTLEDQKFTLGLSGEIDGQATAHVALLDAATACPASPLYPRQIAVGQALTVTADPAAPSASPSPLPLSGDMAPEPNASPTATPDATPSPGPTPAATATPAPTSPTPLGGLVSQQLTVTPKSSGSYHLCGWVLASPATSEASTLARIDHAISVGNRAATINAEMPEAARSGDYFSVKVTGTTAGSGRRLLIMAEPDKDQQCETMRKAASGKRPLQSVVGIGSGNFTKNLRLRYRTKTAGPYLLCIQVVEAADRIPEGNAARVMTVTESLKCVNTQTAITQRRKDLDVIRSRRDAAQKRLSAARKKLAPVRARYSKAKRASNRRIASAQRAVRRAKSAAGKRSARKRLASVRRTEARRIARARAPYAKANASIKVQERTYRQYRTGAGLLSDSIARMKKDTKKYCAAPAR